MNIYNYLLLECQQRDFENQLCVPKASLVGRQQNVPPQLAVWRDTGTRKAIKSMHLRSPARAGAAICLGLESA